jgi:hypothetical protein
MSLNERKTYIYKLLSTSVKLLKETQLELDKAIYKDKPKDRIKFHRVKGYVKEQIGNLERLWLFVKNLEEDFEDIKIKKIKPKEKDLKMKEESE